MTVPLSNIVSADISVADLAVRGASFNTPMIVTCDQSIAPALVKSYSGPASSVLAEIVADGMTSDTSVYRAASKMLSNGATQLKIGRRTGAPIQKYNLIPTSSVDGTVYQILVDDETATYTVDSDTIAQIITALCSAVTALTADVTPTDNTTSMDVTAGASAELNIRFVGPFTIDDTAVASDVDDDLDDIVAVDNDFYGFVLCQSLEEDNQLAAAWAETNQKQFRAMSQTSAPLGGTGFGAELAADGLNYTKLIQNPDPGDFHDAAILAREFSYDPGTYTIQGQKLSNVTVSNYTSGQISALDADNVSYFETLGGQNVFFGSKAASGRATDTTRFVDFLKNEIQVAIVSVILNATNTVGKVPFTDKGISMIAGAVRQVLQRQVDKGALVGKEGTEDQRARVTFPRASGVDLNDKADRHLPEGFFSCVYTGAIETVTIEGIISL